MDKATAGLIAPYAAWMALMMALPSAPWAYAARTAVTAALLVWGSRSWKADITDRTVKTDRTAALAWGLIGGLAVLAIWVLPDSFGWYRRFCVIGDPYTAAASPVKEESTSAIIHYSFFTIHLVRSPLVWFQLFGSAFVISAAEELFFRKWLIRFAGFWWMVALFAVEHNRIVVGAVAGLVYGWLYLRKGLLAAIVAHAVTNLLLGLYVIHFNHWEFW